MGEDATTGGVGTGVDRQQQQAIGLVKSNTASRNLCLSIQDVQFTVKGNYFIKFELVPRSGGGTSTAAKLGGTSQLGAPNGTFSTTSSSNIIGGGSSQRTDVSEEDDYANPKFKTTRFQFPLNVKEIQETVNFKTSIYFAATPESEDIDFVVSACRIFKSADGMARVQLVADPFRLTAKTIITSISSNLQKSGKFSAPVQFVSSNVVGKKTSALENNNNNNTVIGSCNIVFEINSKDGDSRKPSATVPVVAAVAAAVSGVDRGDSAGSNGFSRSIRSRSLVDIARSDAAKDSRRASIKPPPANNGGTFNSSTILDFIPGKFNINDGQMVLIHIHDVWGLSLISNNPGEPEALPAPFISAKTEKDASDGVKAKAVTHCQNAATETMFGEILTLHFNQSYCQTGLPTIVLTIADNVSKRCLAKFNIPISTTFFPSYRQLTLLLRSVSPAADMTAIPHVRLSITNIDTTISCTRILEREYEDQVVFLEMNLRGFSRIPLPFEANAICAVRLVSDGQEYANRLKTLQKRFQSGFPFTAPPLQPHVTLDFDVKGQVLNESNLSRDIYVKGLIYNRGRKPRVPLSEIEDDAPYYQMTVAKGIQLMENNTHVSSNPVWNQNFVFLIDPNEFNYRSSIVLEFYKDPLTLKSTTQFNHDAPDNFSSQSSSSRTINDLFGYSIVPIGGNLFPISDSGKIICLDQIKVNFVGKYVNLAEKHLGANADGVCVQVDLRIPDNWRYLFNGDNPRASVAATTTRGGDPFDPLPDLNFSQLASTKKATVIGKSNQNISKSVTVNETENVAAASRLQKLETEQRQRLIDRLMEELDNRTNAVKKIGADLYQAREINHALEQKVMDLERQLDENHLKTKRLLNTVDVDVVSHEELRRRYALLADKLSIELGRTKELAQDLEAAQESVIKRNDIEKKYLELRHAHTAQSSHVQKLNEGLKESNKYVGTIKKQEQVITKLESLLKENLGDNFNSDKLTEFFDDVRIDVDSFDPSVIRNLKAENQSLKNKLLEFELKGNVILDGGDFKFGNIATATSDMKVGRGVGGNANNNEVEMFKLLMRAEKADTRIQSLERELLDSAKTFAKRLVDLKLKISQQRGGGGVGLQIRSNSPLLQQLSSLNLSNSTNALRKAAMDGVVEGAVGGGGMRISTSPSKAPIYLAPIQ